MTTTGATNQSKTGTTRAHSPLPTLRGASLGLAVLAALIALAFLVLGSETVSAQTPPEEQTLVRNDQYSDDGQVDIASDRAMSFRTGSSGYWLSSVELDMIIANPTGTYPTYTFKLYSDDDTGRPDTALITLTNPGSLRTGLNRFTASGGYRLDPDTWYQIVFSVSNDTGANIGAKLGTTQADDQTGLAGWLIADFYVHKARSATTWTQDNTQTPQFQVKGYTDMTPPVFRSAEVSLFTLTINFDEALYPASVPPTSSFSVEADGTAVMVSRVAVSGSTVTLTLADAVEHDAAVRVSYFPMAFDPPLRDIPGNEVAQFEDRPVTNNTPDFEVGVIYEALNGTARVVRVADGNCYVESYLQNKEGGPFLWYRGASYGMDEDACRKAAWDAHRRSIGQDRLGPDSDQFPADNPPAVLPPRCPSGWHGNVADGQQQCASSDDPQESAVVLSPERAQEFARRGLRPSDATSTDPSRYYAYYSFIASEEHCGEGMVLAYHDGGNGASSCAPEEDLVSCSSGNLHGISGRLCTAPVQNTHVDLERQGRADPRARENSTHSYSNSNTNETQEFGTAGCMRSRWYEGRGWVCINMDGTEKK